MDTISARFLEVLTFPIIHRCPELGMLIDRCSTKQLQDNFPILIRSIFGLDGGAGWGFRTVTKLMNPHEFQILYNFFIPLGPMFRLCYRLLNDSLKFEVPIAYIPEKMRNLLESGRYPLFYSDILNIDPFERTITSLHLNAFDFYILNFAIHGTIPIHKEYSAALAIQNDKLKSVYFFLTADYLCSFLPSDPDAVVMPQNICGTVKTTPVIPVQPIRSPKYLSLSAISRFSKTSTPTRPPDVSRAHAWRSESVLYLFTDVWLRFESDESGDIPSNEFIRVIRILVKQIHAFANCADLDKTSMAPLRKLAQPMINARMYPFLRSIISRWPLDSSFAVVLELWLSFIQPWRYIYNRNISAQIEFPTNPIERNRFKNFVNENIACYTQIFIQLMPRFLSLDLTSFRNCLMVFRLLKVFGQSYLADILRDCEPLLGMSFGSTTAGSFQYHSGTSPRHRGDSSLRFAQNLTQKSRQRSDFSYLGPESYYPDDTYIEMFGPEVQDQIGDLIRKLRVSKLVANEQIDRIEFEKKEKYKGFVGWMRWIFRESETSFSGLTMADRKKIPDTLDICIHTLGEIFLIEVSESPITTQDIYDMTGNTTDLFTYDVSQEFDASNPNDVSPLKMKKRALNINYTGDPDLIPIGGNECTFLVRFLYLLSCKINLMYSHEMNVYWYRNNFLGKIARAILMPPMVVRTFDKSAGYSVLREQTLGPRITLRFIAAYRTIAIILLSFFIGYVFFSAPSFGFFLLIAFLILYILVMSLIRNVPFN